MYQTMELSKDPVVKLLVIQHRCFHMHACMRVNGAAEQPKKSACVHALQL